MAHAFSHRLSTISVAGLMVFIIMDRSHRKYMYIHIHMFAHSNLSSISQQTAQYDICLCTRKVLLVFCHHTVFCECCRSKNLVTHKKKMSRRTRWIMTHAWEIVAPSAFTTHIQTQKQTRTEKTRLVSNNNNENSSQAKMRCARSSKLLRLSHKTRQKLYKIWIQQFRNKPNSGKW